MVSAAVAGDLNGALVYGWRAYQSAAGDETREAEMLLNLSELLLRCGQWKAAAHGFTIALGRHPVARLALPMLGGLGLAASTLGDTAALQAIRARVERLIAVAGLPYQSAAALLELSQALAAIGDATGLAECRAQALEIAERHGYHEITLRLEGLRIADKPHQPEAPHALTPDAIDVARAVASLSPAAAEWI
jgi:tetratricopeptide (TPR) repeat protein